MKTTIVVAAVMCLVPCLLTSAVSTESHPNISTEDYSLKVSADVRVELCQPGNGRPNIRYRVIKLREEMRKRTSVYGVELDAYIIPSMDEHQCEYTAEGDRRLEYISGFSGTLGWAVVGATPNIGAALWTDGRYHLQAATQLPCDWQLVKMHSPSALTIPDWLTSHLKRGARVGADPRLVPHTTWLEWEQELSAKGVMLVRVQPNNLIDMVWDREGRPPPSEVLAYVQDMKYAGVSWQTKVEDLRREIKNLGADAMVVAALDEIAWLLNIRGKDIPYSPVVKSYVIVTQDSLHLYVQPGKLSEQVKLSLQVDACYHPNCTKIHDYEEIWSDLRTFSQAWHTALLPAPYTFYPGVSEAIFTSIPEGKRLFKSSPIINMKAKKNPTEILGMRNAIIRDSAAMCDVLSYIEERFNMGETWTELTLAQEVDLARKSQVRNKGLSFPTIAGYGPNGALPHYIPTNETTRIITKHSTLVLDSGGQYEDGTTDITRTLHFGTPTEEQRTAYTLVLMAAIDLSRLVYPSHLKVSDVDVMGRSILWRRHKDYMHSTGHGIGAFLQVHEAPIQVAYAQRQKVTFKEGYFFSNEPGYYELGHFGVRLENVLEVIEAPKVNNDDHNSYLAFKDVTLVPYEPKLINIDLMTIYQRKWLNEYNIRIREIIGAELKGMTKMRAFHWMMNKTVLIDEYGSINKAPHTYNGLLCFLLNAVIIYIFI